LDEAFSELSADTFNTNIKHNIITGIPQIDDLRIFSSLSPPDHAKYPDHRDQESG
jgi:hypothetical protein